MIRPLRSMAASVFLVSATACASVPLPDVAGRDTPDLERKVVVAKREPQVLVAGDGTRCAASGSKFERVQLGDGVWCLWQRSGTSAASMTNTR